MKKIVLQIVILLISFFITLKLLEQVNWISILHINEVSNYSDEKLGDLFLENVTHNGTLEQDSILINAVDTIFQIICTSNNLNYSDYKLHILKNDETNAFALPGKNIILYSGLLAQSKSDAEIAGVLAHELAHINLNHIQDKLVREIGLSVLISMTSGTIDASMIKETAKMLASTAFDRESELHADSEAVNYLQKSKLNPGDFANILTRISNDTDVKMYSWISTHPESLKRAETIREKIKYKKQNFISVFSKEEWIQMVN